MFGQHKRRWIVAGSALALVLLITFEMWFLGPASLVRSHDTWDSIMSRNYSMMMGLKEEGPSQWCSLIGGGVDRISNDMKYLHLSALLQYLFPGWLGYLLLLQGAYLVQFLAVYWLARRSFKLPPFEAWISGLVGLLALFLHASLYGRADINLSLAMFPLIILWLEAYDSQKPNSRRFVLSGVALILLYSVTSSVIFYLIFAVVACALWFIIVHPRKSLKFWILFTAVWAAVLAFHINDIWAMLTYSSASHRSVWNFMGRTFPQQLVETLANLPLPFIAFFALTTILLFKRRRIDRAWVSLLGLYCLLSFIIPIVFMFLRFQWHPIMPVLKSVNLNRTLHFSNIMLGLVTGYGLASLSKGFGGRKRKVYVITVCVTLAICLAVFKARHFYSMRSSFNHSVHYFVSNPHLEYIKQQMEKSPEPFRIGVIGFDPAIAHMNGIETAGGYLNMYPYHYKRYWSRLIAPLMERDQKVKDYFSSYGSRLHLYITDSDIRSHSPILFDQYYDRDLLALANVSYVWSKHPLIDDRLVLKKEGAPEKAASKLEKWKQNLRANRGVPEPRFLGYVYENPDALPRVFMVDSYIQAQTHDDLYDRLGRLSLEELRDGVVLPPGTSVSGEFNVTNSHVKVVTYSSDEIEIEMSSEGRGILIVTNTYNPNWRCWIDGEEAEIFPAYGTFWGVTAEPGSHRIKFQYDPPYGLL